MRRLLLLAPVVLLFLIHLIGDIHIYTELLSQLIDARPVSAHDAANVFPLDFKINDLTKRKRKNRRRVGFGPATRTKLLSISSFLAVSTILKISLTARSTSALAPRTRMVSSLDCPASVPNLMDTVLFSPIILGKCEEYQNETIILTRSAWFPLSQPRHHAISSRR